jgi:anti-repressor protein
VAEILGYSNTNAMTRRLDSDEVQKFSPYISGDEKKGSGSTTHLTIINESGLYSSIIGSKKEGAKKFKKWIASEVLPAIRKTGS